MKSYPVKTTIKKLGGIRATAYLLGIAPSSVWQWIHERKSIPTNRIKQLKKIKKI